MWELDALSVQCDDGDCEDCPGGLCDCECHDVWHFEEEDCHPDEEFEHAAGQPE